MKSEHRLSWWMELALERSGDRLFYVFFLNIIYCNHRALIFKNINRLIQKKKPTWVELEVMFL